jgi:hypothetical protein
MEALLSREDLKRVNQLGLWPFFASVEQVKRFAAQPRGERRAFFDRFAASLEDESPRAADPDSDHRLFDLPQGATTAQICKRYRELALAFHPDRRDGDHELMQEINLAYRRLLASARNSS